MGDVHIHTYIHACIYIYREAVRGAFKFLRACSISGCLEKNLKSAAALLQFLTLHTLHIYIQRDGTWGY